MSDETRVQIWEDMLNAKMNVRYFKHLIKRYKNLELSMKILLALSSSGTVAGWMIWNKIPGLWQTLSAVAAVIAIINPLLNYPKLISKLANLHGEWVWLTSEHEKLWVALNEGREINILEKFNSLRSKQVAVRRAESDVPYNSKLVQTCQKEVRRAMGLS